MLQQIASRAGRPRLRSRRSSVRPRVSYAPSSGGGRPGCCRARHPPALAAADGVDIRAGARLVRVGAGLVRVGARLARAAPPRFPASAASAPPAPPRARPPRGGEPNPPAAPCSRAPAPGRERRGGIRRVPRARSPSTTSCPSARPSTASRGGAPRRELPDLYPRSGAFVDGGARRRPAAAPAVLLQPRRAPRRAVVRAREPPPRGPRPRRRRPRRRRRVRARRANPDECRRRIVETVETSLARLDVDHADVLHLDRGGSGRIRLVPSFEYRRRRGSTADRAGPSRDLERGPRDAGARRSRGARGGGEARARGEDSRRRVVRRRPGDVSVAGARAFDAASFDAAVFSRSISRA